jgi:putative transposase
MTASDVKATLDEAVSNTGVSHIEVKDRPRLLSDNGPCYNSGELKSYLAKQGMVHTWGVPYHSMTQGKIKRYHRSMKNIVKLQNYYFPWELEQELTRFVNYHNNHRYHESLNNVTPADVYFGQNRETLTKRDQIKRKTLALRKKTSKLGSLNFNLKNIYRRTINQMCL